MALDSMFDRKMDVILLDRSFLADLERKYYWALQAYEATKCIFPIVPSKMEQEHNNPSHPLLKDLIGKHDVDSYGHLGTEAEAFDRHRGKKFYYGTYTIDSVLSEADIEFAALSLHFAKHGIRTAVASADKALVSAMAYEAKEKDVPLHIYSPWTMPYKGMSKVPLIATVGAKKQLRRKGYVLAMAVDNENMHEIVFMGSQNPVEHEGIRSIPAFPSPEFIRLVGPYNVKHTRFGTETDVPVIIPWQLKALDPKTAAAVSNMKHALAFDAVPKGLYGKFFFG